MTTRDRDRPDDRQPQDDAAASAGEGTRSRAARDEMEAEFATLSASVVDRVLTGDHEGFLGAVRQSGGQ